MNSRIRAFTIVEIMIVVMIIGLLAAIAMPMIGKVSERNTASITIGNARMLENALVMYRSQVSSATPYNSAPNNSARYLLVVDEDRWETAPSSLSELNDLTSPWVISLPGNLMGEVTISQSGNSVRLNEIESTADLP